MLDYSRKKNMVQPAIEKKPRIFLSVDGVQIRLTWCAFFIGVSSGGLVLYANNPWIAVLVLWISGFLRCGRWKQWRDYLTLHFGGERYFDITFDRNR